MRQNEITFEDAGAEQDAEQNATYSIPYPVSAWYGMATDETLSLEERDEAAKQLEALADGGAPFTWLRRLLDMFPGQDPVIIYLSDQKRKLHTYCQHHQALLGELGEVLGQENVVLKGR